MVTRLAILVVCVSCGGEAEPTVRLCNDTEHDFNAVAWNTIYAIDFLQTGHCTDYEMPTHEVYRYTRVVFRVQTDEFQIQPIDFVGETPLGEGAWSYHVTITDYASRSAQVEARRD
jgi:hypothetical protein